jgi:alkylation response protein AidB-like acyl-CoA dehydrogenase
MRARRWPRSASGCLGRCCWNTPTKSRRRNSCRISVAGKTRWCQGYSEPGAGSDLASLQTKCEDKGDHWLINGSKIWTSYANHADWIFCLVRTDFTKKHEGISFVLFDMTTAGVETRPILLISGSSPFCETFFTDVKVPKDQLVGTPGKGWDIAKRLLQYERQNISATGFGADRNSGPTLADIAKKYVGTKDGIDCRWRPARSHHQVR